MTIAQDDAIKPVRGKEQTARDTHRSTEELQQLARLAEISERYEDMKGYMKELVIGKQGEISIHECDLLSTAYKRVVASIRTAYRIVQNIRVKRISDDVVEEYRSEIQKRLMAVCSELQDLLSHYLIPKAEDDRSKVFYLKMLGDYTRYMAETQGQGDDFKEIVEESRSAYQQAYDLAKKTMPPTDPILLGLVLNYSVFYYEIANAAPEAARLVKKAYHDAVANLEDLDESVHSPTDHPPTNAAIIMELMRENLIIWKSDGEAEASGDEQASEGPTLEELPSPNAINKEGELIAALDSMQVNTPSFSSLSSKEEEDGEQTEQERAKTETDKDEPSTEAN